MLHVVLHFRAVLDHKVCRVHWADPEVTAAQESTQIQALPAYLENR